MASSNTEARRPLRNRVIAGALVFMAYLAIAIAPLIVLIAGPVPAGREFLREMSVALAFCGASALMLQFALAARFRRLKSPFGVDAVYHFHREVGYVGLALVAVHPILLFVLDPALLSLLDPTSAPWRARFALLAVISAALTVGLAVLRDRLGTRYERWRWLHGWLAIAAVGFAVAHIEGVGHYVNTPAKRVLWVVYPIAWFGVVAWSRWLKPALELKKPWRVAEVREEAGDAVTITLEPVGHAGMDFAPGQFAWLILGRTPYAIDEHPFSMSGSAEQARLQMTIKRLGDWTAGVGDTPTGTAAYLDGPYGTFSTERYPADRYLFVAGGVGITPFMSILRTFAERGDRRPISLIFGVSTRADATFGEELEELTRTLSLDLVFLPSSPDPDWEGPSGFVTAELLREHLPQDASERSAAECFVCGPPPMMVAVEHHLRDLGVAPWRIHYERFDLV